MTAIVPFNPAAARPRSSDARERLLQAAAPLFASRGFNGVSVRELAESAGVNVAAISYHFGGKAGLYTASLEVLMEKMRPVGGPVIAMVDQAFKAGAPDGPACAALMASIVRHILTTLLDGSLPPWVTQTVLREFQEPTEDYRPMFDERVLPLQRAIRKVVAAALELAPESPRAVLASQAVIGQIMVFAATRHLVLEELQWTNFSGERLEIVIETAQALVLRSICLTLSEQ